ncbi:Beta-ketoacyl-[acyl-carrier-protein] synthase I [Durusdinium trenchii]|uniref:Beta-ketoacyl-[acyl-carrier-protein] synthase I n=1 Tax=Durusdinium trenchii TaxID=1381693 RepID=A0ABP0SAP4_9DINO
MFAFAMFGFCVIVLTAADVLLLALSAWRLGEVEGPCRFYSWAKMVRKLAMLDVSIMGVYVITFCMGIYKKQGIVVSTREGLPVLIAAEVMHTLIYWLVSGTVEAHEAAATEQKLYEYKVADTEEGSPKKLDFCCHVNQFLSRARQMGVR